MPTCNYHIVNRKVAVQMSEGTADSHETRVKKISGCVAIERRRENQDPEPSLA